MSLETPDKIRTPERKLYVKAKAEPEFRFYLLHDKICRADILAHAYALASRRQIRPPLKALADFLRKSYRRPRGAS